MRATLERVLTEGAFDTMFALAERWAKGVQATIDRYELPWSVTRLGARAEYRFSNPAPSSGGASNASTDPQLEDYIHVYLANRDVLLTPFHNMALMCPATTRSDVDKHREAFDSCIAELVDHQPVSS
jgi:glutamate-1-semialdehyde 2,1-aminomutase